MDSLRSAQPARIPVSPAIQRAEAVRPQEERAIAGDVVEKGALSKLPNPFKNANLKQAFPEKAKFSPTVGSALLGATPGLILGGATAGLAAAGSVLGVGSLFMPMVGAIFGGLGLGAAASTMKQESVTQSGVQVTNNYHSMGLRGTSLQRDEYRLPTGTEFKSTRHNDAKPEISARDQDGNKLQAEVVKDHATGRTLYQTTDPQGRITQFDPVSLDFSIADPRQTTKNADGTVVEHRGLKQTVHADGSSEFIAGETSTTRTVSVPDLLRTGEMTDKTMPVNHSFYKVNLSPTGDTQAELHTRKFSRVSRTDGDVGLRRGAPQVEDLSTSFFTRGSEFTLRRGMQASGAAIGGPAGLALQSLDLTSVKPFVSLEQMDQARQTSLQARLDKATMRFEKPESLKSPDGSKWVVDTEGSSLAIQGRDGNVNTGYVYGGIKSLPVFDEKGNGFIVSGKDQLHRYRPSGFSSESVDLGGKLKGEPGFDSDGNLVVHVEKGSRTVQRTLNPNSLEVLNTHLLPNT